MILPEEEAKPHANLVKGVIHDEAHGAGNRHSGKHSETNVLSRLPLKY